MYTGTWKRLVKEGKLILLIFSTLRGLTFSDQFVLVDEAQNASLENLKEVCKRPGERCRVVVTGGTDDQVDRGANWKKAAALHRIGEKMKRGGAGVTHYVEMDEVERSEASKCMDDLFQKIEAEDTPQQVVLASMLVCVCIMWGSPSSLGLDITLSRSCPCILPAGHS